MFSVNFISYLANSCHKCTETAKLSSVGSNCSFYPIIFYRWNRFYCLSNASR